MTDMLEDPFHFSEEGESLQRAGFFLSLLWLACLIVLALIFSGYVMAQERVFRSIAGNGRPMALRLLEPPCADATVLKYLTPKVAPDYLVKFKAAVLTWEGRNWESCWIEFDKVIYSIDEEGVQLQPIPKRLFKDEAT